MKFRMFEVGWDEDNTGGATRYICTDTLTDARKIAREQVEYDASRNMDDNGRVVRSDLSSVAIQEYLLIGTPKQVAAAAVIVINSDFIGWSESSKLKRAEIQYGRRWNLNYAGKLQEPYSLTEKGS